MKYLIILSLCSLFTIGCGGSSNEDIEGLQKSQKFFEKQLKQQAIQISELKTQLENSNKKTLSLENDFKKLKLTNTQLFQMIERVRKQSVQQKPQATSQNNKANAALLVAQQRKMVYTMVRGMSNTRKAEDIANMLNQRNLKDNNKQAWTAQSVNAYMRKNSLGSYAQNKQK